MKHGVRHWLWQLVLLACMAQGIAAHAQDSNAASKRLATLIYSKAIQEAAIQNADAVYDMMHHVLAIVPDHSAALYWLTPYESHLRNDSLATAYLKRSVELDPENPDYIETLAGWYLQKFGDTDAALELCERLASIQKYRSEIYMGLCNLYKEANRFDDAIDALNTMERHEGKSRWLAMLKYNIFMESKQDTTAAFAELYSLAKEYPADIQHKVLLAEQYMADRDMPDSAKVLLDEAAGLDPENEALQMALLKYAESYDTIHYEKLRDSLLYASKTSEALRRELIVDQMKSAISDSVARIDTGRMFARLIAAMPDNMNVWSCKAVYQQMMHAPADSMIECLNAIRRIEPDNRMALTRLLQCHAQNEDYAAISQLCDDGILYYPRECTFYYYSGMAYYQRDDKATALERFTQATRQIDHHTDAGMAARIFSAQADLLYAAGRNDEAFAAYDSCLAYNPDDVLCLNNYAYYLSLENRTLQRAEEMSYRTLRLAPDNRTYIDTYAWILFMEGQYENARTHIDKVMEGVHTAADADSLDISSDIAEHAGDIYACIGRIDEAVGYWKLALEIGSKHKALIIKKIKRRKYIKQQ